ncbi:AAA domain protein [Hydrogenophaga sp. RAC07]|uniref:AAA family ATPase n=1 Tax=Hydrogenophaga sp. RAC07 TaxID=1842537 RepID=UPI00083CAD9C|nr:AAA family ATPase [Hydrogenophaga sp. RAC07]AOF85141.1 AAA domain protein [Hydrogenophaga sp. RAC07]
MSLDRIQLLRNVGQFDSVNSGAHLPLGRLALVYAENGRGKTTLAAILRSAANGDAAIINERQRLGSQHPPHIVIAHSAGAPLQFQNGAWSAQRPSIAVFDDFFVSQNVCAGVEIETAHRQNLHELILGSQGVALNVALQAHVARIEEHNSALHKLGDAIPAAARGALNVNAYCALHAIPNVDHAVQEAERQLAAARSADAIRKAPEFATIALPTFDIGAINKLLTRTLPDLEAAAAASVQEHLSKLGRDGAAWVGTGLGCISVVSAGQDHEICPFCAQDLSGSTLIQHYQAYFSAAYEALKDEVLETIQSLTISHGDRAVLTFERAVREAERNRTFWAEFLDVPKIDLDTEALTQAWAAARNAVADVLATKQASPLDAMELPKAALAAIETYDTAKAAVTVYSDALRDRNIRVALVKAQAAAANIAELSAKLNRLKSAQARYSAAVAPHCDAYLAEKALKAQTEDLRDRARTALDHYRQQIFPAYQASINGYLERFNAGFRLESVSSVNNRGGSSCTYNVLINDQAVPLTSEAGPSFRNTLSAGDRNALALAFFFASLDQDAQLAQKVVVIDDPMTSLDEHRSLTTVQEMRRLLARVSQVIVLSHSKPFLCGLWEGADVADRTAMRVSRDGVGSTLSAWDVRQDCITEHDKRHEMVTRYLQVANPAEERMVAIALRFILEAFARVAYPAVFQPGALLGPFIGICEQRANTQGQILCQSDIDELRDLLAYANLFHHDSNPAWATQAINDQALMQFARRTLAFARRS